MYELLGARSCVGHQALKALLSLQHGLLFVSTMICLSVQSGSSSSLLLLIHSFTWTIQGGIAMINGKMYPNPFFLWPTALVLMAVETWTKGAALSLSKWPVGQTTCYLCCCKLVHLEGKEARCQMFVSKHYLALNTSFENDCLLYSAQVNYPWAKTQCYPAHFLSFGQ